MKYDLLHNEIVYVLQSFWLYIACVVDQCMLCSAIDLEGAAEELHDVVNALADIVVPQVFYQ